MEIRKNVLVELELPEPDGQPKKALGIILKSADGDNFWIEVIHPESLNGFRTVKQKDCLSPIIQLQPGERPIGKNIATYLKGANAAL